MTEATLPEIDIVAAVAKELTLPLNKVRATAELLADGNTVPFISRYRKEVTGNLDEVQIRDIQVTTKRLDDLQARKQSVARQFVNKMLGQRPLLKIWRRPPVCKPLKIFICRTSKSAVPRRPSPKKLA